MGLNSAFKGLISSLKSVRLECVKIILVSSANMVGVDISFLMPGKSLM